MNSYTDAISCTENGYLYVDTSNTTKLKPKYTIRNFIAPIYSKTKTVHFPKDADRSVDDKAYLKEPIRAIAKKDHQFLYADPREKVTF